MILSSGMTTNGLTPRPKSITRFTSWVSASAIVSQRLPFPPSSASSSGTINPADAAVVEQLAVVRVLVLVRTKSYSGLTSATSHSGAALAGIAPAARDQGTLISPRPPRRRFLSTRPLMPFTLPELVCCQIDHPRPFQSSAGTLGSLTPQFATHKWCPARANRVVSPVARQLEEFV
jgi:hypothetical protein